MSERGVLVVAIAPLVVAIGLGGAPAAPSAAALSISPDVGRPRIPITAHGSGFAAGETVDLSFDGSPIGAVQTQQDGTFVIKVRIPSSALPGDHEVLATGETSGLTASATYLVRTDWARFSFDGANRWNRFENVLNPDNVGQLTELWSVAYCCGDLVLAGGVLYGSNGDGIIAFDAATGSTLWFSPLASVVLDPIVVDGMVFVGVEGGHVVSLDAATGAVVWSVILASLNAGARLAADAERLYVPMNDKTLTALDLQDGATAWKATLSADPAGPAVAGGVVYVTALNGTYALDAATGARIWTSAASCSCEAVTYAAGLVFTGHAAGPGNFSALDAATGRTVWSVELDHGYSYETAPAVADGVLYLPTADLGWFYALDASTGAIIWRNQDSDFWAESPAVANGVVYVANDDYGLFAYDAVTGRQLFSVYQWVVQGPPIVADGRVYVGLGDELIAMGLPGG